MDKEECQLAAGNNNYSSPMPAIGVYIMISTLVCLLFVSCDMLLARRHKKPWVPCRFFSLNSLTLTLLGISTKLTGDLTSPMPRVVDQLSKLCGTQLIIISMGFFLPSLADMEGSELFANMASLTIFVLTVIINICIEMATGVIFSFFMAELVVTLILMLLTLMAMWHSAFIRGWMVGTISDSWKQALNEDFSRTKKTWCETSHLKKHYVRNYILNPQLRMSLHGNCVIVGFFCILSPLILLVALLRCFFTEEFKFCEGESDYKWSMGMVVLTQLLTLLVGIYAITVRSIFVATRTKWSSTLEPWKNWRQFNVFAKILLSWEIGHIPSFLSRKPIIKFFHVLENFLINILFVTVKVMIWMNKAILLSARLLRKLFVRSETSLHRYLSKQGFKNFQRLVDKHSDNPGPLIKLPSKKQYPFREPALHEGSNHCFLLVLLVRVVSVSLPSHFSKALNHALNEAFEILYFIELRKVSSVRNNDFKMKAAKDLWMNRELSNHWFQKEIASPLREKYAQLTKASADAELPLQNNLEDVYAVMNEFTESLDLLLPLTATEECVIIKEVIQKRCDGSVNDLCDRILHLFIYILCENLRTLPGIISEYLYQSPASAREKRLKNAVKFMCKFEQLKPYIIPLTEEQDGSDSTNAAPVSEFDAHKGFQNVVGDIVIEVAM